MSALSDPFLMTGFDKKTLHVEVHGAGCIRADAPGTIPPANVAVDVLVDYTGLASSGHTGAYRTDVYEGTMISGATPSRMVHLRQVIEQREFFMGECHAAAERLEAMPEPLIDQARWSLESYRANHSNGAEH